MVQQTDTVNELLMYLHKHMSANHFPYSHKMSRIDKLLFLKIRLNNLQTFAANLL